MERLDQESRRVSDLVLGDTGTDWLRLTAILQSEVQSQIDECTWEQLQQSAELIPIFVREIVNDEVRGNLEQIAHRLGRLRAEVLQDCQEAIRTMNSNLAFEFQDLGELAEDEFEFKLHPDLFRANLKQISTLTIGSTLALALATGFLFGGIGALVMFGGGVLAGTKLNNVFRSRAREQIKREIEEPVGELVDRIQANVRAEVHTNLCDFEVAVDHSLERTISGVEESLSRLAADMESAERTAPQRRQELEADRQELLDIEGLLQQASFFSV
ncbi:MAG: hypothetical protein COS65_11485 [Armatimonadetes bacterium CG06_land_8_20_14_3_00_66_21]|nr:MAG: hypothetical protein COS65_11485 [Armatimonadetes bacterium CG06_land_8_20_14_3_00_66_21]